MLKVIELYAGYKKDVPVLNNISLEVYPGERIGITGQNGSGKSTLARVLMGLIPWFKGGLSFENQSLHNVGPEKRINLGIACFMQGGRVYRSLSVEENLKIAAPAAKNFNIEKELNNLGIDDLALFSNKSRRRLPAGNLSGGERHILAFSMVMLSCPKMKLLIADEPSSGLSQHAQIGIHRLLKEKLERDNISLILIEQNKAFLKGITNNIYNLKSQNNEE